jgi:hypothetical protein
MKKLTRRSKSAPREILQNYFNILDYGLNCPTAPVKNA